MKVVSVINYKGGVGKTTLTANIAAELASRGKRVLLLDADPQCSLTFSFVSPKHWEDNLGGGGKLGGDKTIKSWFDGVCDRELPMPKLGELVIPCPRMKIADALAGADGGVDLIPSHLGLINIDLKLSSQLGGYDMEQTKRSYVRVHGRLRGELRQFASESGYDLTLIDCPPNFNIVTKNAIAASDAILIPARPDYLSTLGMEYLVRSHGELVENFNEFSGREEIAPGVLGVVFTMVHPGGPIAAQRPYMSPKRVSVPVFSRWVRDNKTFFANAPEEGIPVVLGGDRPPHSDIVSEIKAVTDEFWAKVEELT